MLQSISQSERYLSFRHTAHCGAYRGGCRSGTAMPASGSGLGYLLSCREQLLDQGSYRHRRRKITRFRDIAVYPERRHVVMIVW